MKTKLIILLFTICGSSIAQSPNWQWAKGAGGNLYDYGTAICTDANGISYVTGVFESSSITFGNTTLTNIGSVNIFIVKYDAAGNVLWAKREGRNGIDLSSGICSDVNGNFYLIGSSTSDTLTFGNTVLTYTGGKYTSFVVKYDSMGNVLWAKRVNNSSYDTYGQAINVDVNGNCYIAGEFTGHSTKIGNTTLTNADVSGNTRDIFVAKYDSVGNLLWAKSATGSTQFDFVNDIIADGNGNCYVTGSFQGANLVFGNNTLTNSDASANSLDIYFAKYDAVGNVLWAKNALGSATDYPGGISLDANGNCYITGCFASVNLVLGNTTLTHTNNLGNGKNVFITKCDPAGNIIWAKSAGGTTNAALRDYANDIITDASGNSYITGTFESDTIVFGNDTLAGYINASADLFVVKYNNLGNVLWAKSAGRALYDSGKSISIDAIGNSYITGSFESYNIAFGSTILVNGGISNNTHDFFVAKLDNTGAITNIEPIANNLFANIFPNPNNGIFNFFNLEKVITIEIYDITGKIIFQKQTNENNLQVDLSEKDKGIYFYRVTNKNNEVQQGKIVLQ